jgi:hypothetical protein
LKVERKAVFGSPRTPKDAISTAADVLLTLAVARLVRVGRFADLAAPRQVVHAHVTKERA